MTYDEAKQAYLDKAHVWHNGIQYDYIQARKIQRADPFTNTGPHVMLLELMDFNHHSITVAPVDKVTLAPPEPPKEE